MSGRRTHGLQQTEAYRLDRFWCLNLIQGSGELRIGGHPYPFKHGFASITWPGVDLVYKFKEKTYKTWAHFIPSQDPAAELFEIPIMQDLGLEFERMRAELQMVSSIYRAEPARAIARLWDILWRLVPTRPLKHSNNPLHHPVVSRAMDEIDMHLSEAISVEALAQELAVSQTHLNRCFKAATGLTVSHYIRGQRMEAARHLLMHTTMSIKQIAAHVGICDTQHFNKLVRQQYHMAPSKLRGSNGGPIPL